MTQAIRATILVPSECDSFDVGINLLRDVDGGLYVADFAKSDTELIITMKRKGEKGYEWGQDRLRINLSPNIKTVYWSAKDINSFRRVARKHNQLIVFGFDPEYGERIKRVEDKVVADGWLDIDC